MHLWKKLKKNHSINNLVVSTFRVQMPFAPSLATLLQQKKQKSEYIFIFILGKETFIYGI